MDGGANALRGLLFSDEDMAFVCSRVLTVLAHGKRPAETIEFNELDVTVDRDRRSVTFQGVLSVSDEVVQVSEERFVEVASTMAQPLSGQDLADWHQDRGRPVWPMPPPAK